MPGLDGTCPTGPGFDRVLNEHGLGPLRRAGLQELQVNVGRLCNQACTHCHVDAGPKRTEVMTWNTMRRILSWTRQAGIQRVDITGGAPELNPDFRRLVDSFLSLKAAVTVRCNLTVLFQPGQQDTAQWYAERSIRLVCSMPCYSRENVDRQRGKGVFDDSIRALRLLNEYGYGTRAGLVLDLVYNPAGASLPPDQAVLSADYKKRLREDFGIRFNNLLALANLPINRFAHYLQRSGQTERYQQLLVDNFNPQTVPGLMCRHLISVDWTGRIYDCDFNQMLELPMPNPARYLWDLDPARINDTPVAVGRHCFGCTAGAGSSCGGALT